MEDRRAQFQVGLLVVAALVLAGILIVIFGESPTLGAQQYTIYVRFPQAPGVNVDTPVLKSGILIGRVSRVTLLDQGGVVVTARIDSQRRLTNNEVCRISRGAILGGDAILEFVPTGINVPSMETYADGEYLDGIVARDPLSAMDSATSVLEMLSDLEQDVRLALVSIEGAGRQVGQVAQSLNGVVENNQDQLQRIMSKAETAMDRLDVALGAVNELVTDDDIKVLIDQAVDQLPEIMVDAREVLSGLKGVTARADQNLKNLEGLTGPIGERGEDLAVALERSISQIDSVFTQANSVLGDLATFTKALNQSDGTVSQLLNDKELYDTIVQTANNVELLTGRLRPIVEDARVFVDKIARDPGRLGAKGLLDRTQSGAKY